jgi:hypothetical protein
MTPFGAGRDSYLRGAASNAAARASAYQKTMLDKLQAERFAPLEWENKHNADLLSVPGLDRADLESLLGPNALAGTFADHATSDTRFKALARAHPFLSALRAEEMVAAPKAMRAGLATAAGAGRGLGGYAKKLQTQALADTTSAYNTRRLDALSKILSDVGTEDFQQAQLDLQQKQFEQEQVMADLAREANRNANKPWWAS